MSQINFLIIYLFYLFVFMKLKNYLGFSKFFNIRIFNSTGNTRTILSDSFEIHYWSFSELLIYYPGRFIRRGFIGQIIQLIG